MGVIILAAAVAAQAQVQCSLPVADKGGSTATRSVLPPESCEPPPLSLADLKQQASAADALGWSDNLTTAMDTAKRTDRDILVLFTKPNCEPCLRLQAVTLNDSYIKMRLEQFVLVHADEADPRGPAVRYNVDKFPALLRLNPGGEALAKLEGEITKDELLGMLRARPTPDRATSSPATVLR